VLKPSELAPHTADAVAAMLAETFAPELVSVLNGGANLAAALLNERFDKIFFTGSTRVGQVVMAAAAKHLTPVTLELGGKCPAIVCADAAIEQAAKRIAWGKFMNAGQTCVAPDIVFVQRRVRAAFVAALKNSLCEFYGEDASRSPDYGRIVNARHFERLANYLHNGKILHGGEHDAKDLFLAPTILTDVSPASPVMQEEIFGPILPVLEFEQLDDVLTQLRGKPTPLALYVFTRDRTTETRVLAETRSGGVCVNDVVTHMIGTGLPFGGLGESGMGAYHGRAGFETFSHQRAVLRRATWLDLPFRYPPARLSLTGLRRAMRLLLGD
jgi:acyl-CoA reductase-like NAD-dependent aldehyde dehydrogenase